MWGAIKQWWMHSWIALDQFANAFLFGGYPDETISSRLGRLRPSCVFCRFVCRILNFVFRQPDHCKTALENERKRKGFPPELRKQ
jgi:hypothetical protein